MITRMSSILPRLALMVVFVANAYSLFAQQNEPVYDGDINVKSFEEMLYSPIARQARIEGTVVVSAKLDGDGKVVSTSAISGPKLLIPDSLSNAKRLKFSPNTNGSAIIIYEFRIVEGKCKRGTHYFEFHKPNRASIIGCGVYTWQP